LHGTVVERRSLTGELSLSAGLNSTMRSMRSHGAADIFFGGGAPNFALLFFHNILFRVDFALQNERKSH